MKALTLVASLIFISSVGFAQASGQNCKPGDPDRSCQIGKTTGSETEAVTNTDADGKPCDVCQAHTSNKKMLDQTNPGSSSSGSSSPTGSQGTDATK